jgi:hypothetical protein
MIQHSSMSEFSIRLSLVILILFRVCVARLYGGGPPLHLSPAFISTPIHPLTPRFPAAAPRTELPQGHHPATPRFLLSLLVTALYLSIPATASQALGLILSSVGPHTAIDYLNFALGRPIRSPGDDEPVAAVGLEQIAQIAPTVKDEPLPSLIEPTKENPVYAQTSSKKSSSRALSFCSDESDSPVHEPTSHYGTISNKIGEAAACWLARWGHDILKLEEKKREDADLALQYGIDNSASDNSIPVVWARGGLNPRWVNVLISSDALFVRGERERYDFAKSVVELRRKDGADPAEEEEWRKMFSLGIYYTHMVRYLSSSLPICHAEQ